MSLVLDVRTRAVSYFAMLLPLTLLSRSRGHGFEVLASPLGAGLLAVLLIAGGAMVEDRGGVASIRAGSALRALAPLLIVVAYAVALVWGRSYRLAYAPVWSFAAVAVFFTHIGYCGARDIATALDPRNGQRVRFDRFDDTALRLRARDGEVTVPLDAIRSARVETFLNGRGVSLTLASRERVWGDVEALPWLTLAPLTMLLTEHQIGLDADAFARACLDRAERAGRYR